jgi:hypothetical protein
VIVLNLLKPKWTKVVLAVVLAIVVAVVSSVGTYFYMIREQQNVPAKKEKETGEQTENSFASVENGLKQQDNDLAFAPETEEQTENSFASMVNDIKKLAHDAVFISGYHERASIVDAVVESLKKMLISEYASMIHNGTFNDDELTVNIANYPLRDGRSLKNIQFIMKNNEGDDPYDESHFFLQYCGKEPFFSDMEYYDPRDQSFQVFENKDGCFAFSISSGYEDKVFSSDMEFSNYTAKVFILGDTEFSVEFVRIPLKVAHGYNFRLVQQKEIIKGIVCGNDIEQFEGLSECLFNSSNLSFEIPKIAIRSDPIDYGFPGLLLGLSDSQGNIRTLFIRKEDDRICADEYRGQIIFPQKGKLFSLKHYIQQDESYETYEDETGDELIYRIGTIGIKKLLCVPLGDDVAFELDATNDSDELTWSFCESTAIPLYVGEEYVCYIQNSLFSGGGSFHAAPSEIRFDKLEDLPKFSFGYRMVPSFQETTLTELVYGEKAEDYYQANARTYGGRTNPYVDFKQLSIKRNLGKWSLMLPVIYEDYHPGNGSYSNWVHEFASFSNDIPSFLASNTEAMELLDGWEYWDAKDLIRFPESRAVLAQYNYYIGIGNQEDNHFQESLDLKIQIALDEYIVSINFANAATQNVWKNELSKINGM